MNVQQSVKMILARFNARKFDARVAREELASLSVYCNEKEQVKLAALIKTFRRPGFDTPEFRKALLVFQQPSEEEQAS